MVVLPPFVTRVRDAVSPASSNSSKSLRNFCSSAFILDPESESTTSHFDNFHSTVTTFTRLRQLSLEYDSVISEARAQSQNIRNQGSGQPICKITSTIKEFMKQLSPLPHSSCQSSNPLPKKGKDFIQVFSLSFISSTHMTTPPTLFYACLCLMNSHYHQPQ